MAKPVCDINPAPRFVQEASQEWQLLADVFQDGRNVQTREGYDPKFLRWSYGQLKQMLPLDIEKAMEYVESQGWAKLDVKASKAAGRNEYAIRKMRGAQEGEVSAVLKDYLLSASRGVKQLAGEFQMKVRNGLDAEVEGLRLAKSLRTMGSMGELVLGLDQSYGRGMRANMLRKKRKVQLGDGGVAELDATEMQRASTDVLTRIAEQMNDPATQREAVDELMRIADTIMFVKDPMAIAKAGLGVNFASDAWQEMFMNGLLSSPDTLAANASGAVWVPMRAWAQKLGAGMMSAMPGEIGAAGRQQWVEATAKIAAMNQSFADAARLGWEGFKDNRFMYGDPEGAMSRSLTGANAANFAKEKFGVEIADSYQSVIDGVGTVINTPSRTLMATDEFARHIALRGEVAARAVRKAQTEGIDIGSKEAMDAVISKEFKEAFDLDPLSGREWFYSQAYDVKSALDPGGKAVSQDVREGVFQESNTWATNVQNVMPTALRPMLPFVRTPLNILKQGIKETTIIGPLLHVGGAVKNNAFTPTEIIFDIQKRMLNNPADTARITGQISLMTAIGGMLYSQAIAGNITGGGPERFMGGPEGRKAQQAWQRVNVPYSIRIGDQAVPFTRFPEPVATLMKIYADMGMASGYMTDQERDDAFAAVALVGVTGLYQSSMLTGLNDIMGIFTGGLDDVDRRLGTAVQRYAATQVPMGSLLAYVDRGIDPYKSAYQAPSFSAFFTNWGDVFGNGVLGKVADRFPGASAERPVQIDQIGGDPVPLQPGVGITGINPMLAGFPLVPRNVPSDPAWQAIYDIAQGWTDYRPPIELTTPEQMELNRRMGTLRIGGKLLREQIIALRNRPDVEQYVQMRGASLPGRATDIERELNALKRQYGKAALSQMQVGNISISQRAAVQDQLNRARRTNDVNRVRTLQGQLEDLLQRANRGY